MSAILVHFHDLPLKILNIAFTNGNDYNRHHSLPALVKPGDERIYTGNVNMDLSALGRALTKLIFTFNGRAASRNVFLEKGIFVMKHVIRIAALAILLCTTLVVGSLVYHHEVAHACGSYEIPHSNVTVLDFHSSAINGSLELWYNSCSQQNYAYINIHSGNTSGTGFTLWVQRLPGPDGGSIRVYNDNCPASGVCTTSGVYSPNNIAQACMQNADLLACTDTF